MAKHKLEEVCELITDGTHQTPEYCDHGGVIFLSSKDVTDRKINWDNAKRIPERLHEQLCKRVTPQKNDILLAKNGTTGVAAIVDREETFDIYVSLAVLRPSSNISPRYLLYAINSPAAKRQFNAGLKGIGVPNLHLNVIRNTELNFVDRSQQDLICKKLDNVASIIYMKKTQLEKLDTLIKARFVEMFGDPNDESLRWKAVLIGDNCFVTKLAGFEYTNYIHYANHGDVVMVKAQNVKNGTLNEKELSYITNDVSDSLPRSQLAPGDIVMTYVGANIGDVAIIDDKHKYHLAPNVAKIRPDDKVYNSIFFMYMLMMKTDYIVRNSADTAKAALGMERIRKLEVFSPPMKLQKEFSVFVSQVDKTKLAVQKSLNEAQLLFDSLMQEYFG